MNYTIYDMPLTNKILISSSKTTDFRIIKMSFGDGYSQRAPNGINNRIDSWDVTWGALTFTEVDFLETTLGNIGGHNVVRWTPSGETTEKFFINKNSSYSKTRTGNVFSITCSFEQIYDPETASA